PVRQSWGAAIRLRVNLVRATPRGRALLQPAQARSRPDDPLRQDRVDGRVLALLAVISSRRGLDRGSLDGAGHAAGAATALAEFEAFDLDYLDAAGSQLPVGELVLVVADHDAGGEGEEVVARVPLFAGLLVVVAAGGDQLQFADAEGFRDRAGEARVEVDVEGAGFVGWAEGVGGGGLQEGWVDGCFVHVQEGEDGVQVHVRTAFGDLDGDHAVDGASLEQREREVFGGARVGPLAQADHDGAVADGHHVAALHGG